MKGTITLSMMPAPHDLSTLQSLTWPTMMIVIVVLIRVPAQSLPTACQATIGLISQLWGRAAAANANSAG
ncbi:hypothetical protein [Kitasatospora cystarginea]